MILKAARIFIWSEMVTATMKQIKFSVPLMVETAAIHVLTRNFAKNVSV